MEPVTFLKPLDPAQRSLAMRRRPPSIELPRPEALTGTPAIPTRDAAALLRWGRDTASLPVVWDVWRRRITCFLSTWEAPGGHLGAETVDAHDSRLGISRSRADPTMALLHGVAVSLDRFCQECTGSREFREHAVIPAALIEIWQTLLQDPAPVRPSVTHRLADLHGRAPDAARRWAIGHHLLATLTQGQIVSLLAYESLQPSPGTEQTRQFLQRTALLCQAGAAACRFTADLAHAPGLPVNPLTPGADSASETLPAGRSSDHQQLMAVIARLRPALSQARSICPDEHAAMTAAVSRFCIEHRRLRTRSADATVPAQPVTRRQPPASERFIEPTPLPVVVKVAAPARFAATAVSRRPTPTDTSGSLVRLLTRLAGARVSAHP